MNIWLINHYAVPPKYYPLSRTATFAKYLKRAGHDVTIFAASTVHNSTINLIEDKTLYKEIVDNDIRYVLINCKKYQGNGLSRIKNMIEFANKLKKVCNHFEKPDAILATSITLQACKKSIQIAKKYHCKVVAEIADLWPETLIAYGAAKKYNPIVIYLRKIEKWIYKNADKVVFTMEGAYDYIKERKWENILPLDKVEFINNGVDLELFESNASKYKISDSDLTDNSFFKAIYVGAIRKANDVGQILEIAQKTKDKKIKYLIYGGGDQLEELKDKAKKMSIENVLFKGPVQKKYIPYIIKQADLSLFIVKDTPITRFGISPNKLFDYFAAGKPLLISNCKKYNPALTYNVGLMPTDDEKLSDVVLRFYKMNKEEYDTYCDNAIKASKAYDFKNLTNRLINMFEK